jgi:hypothetical protein
MMALLRVGRDWLPETGRMVTLKGNKETITVIVVKWRTQFLQSKRQ